MILVCPECNARYLLSASAIGETGREVRCANCQHQWFQEPKKPEPLFDPSPRIMDDDDDDFETPPDDEEDDFDVPSQKQDSFEEDEETPPKKLIPEEPIPDSVKPLPEGSNFPAFRPPEDELPRNTKAKAAAWLLSLVLLAGVIISAALYKDRILTLWPASAALYELAGFDIELMGEGLIIEKAKASIVYREGQDALLITGNILNLKRSSLKVPLIQATLRDEDGNDRISFQIEPPVNIVEPGASFPFSAEYLDIEEGDSSVNLTFNMKIAP